MKQTIINALHPLRRPLGPLLHLSAIAAIVLAFALGMFTQHTIEQHGGGFIHTKTIDAPVVHVYGGGKLPQSWSLVRYVKRIHQQDVSNSCLSQTISTMAEILAGERHLHRALSGGWIWRLGAGGANAPMTFQQGFGAWEAYGVAPLSVYPNDGVEPGPAPTTSQYTAAFPYRISSWAQIWNSDDATMEAEIHAGRPFAVALPVYTSLEYNTQAYVTSQSGVLQFWHVMTAVAYSPSGLTLQNSYGPSWGYHGRVTVPWSFLTAYGAGIGIANPIGTYPHSKKPAPFPVKAWTSFTHAHQLKPQPYKSGNRLTHLAWSWQHDHGLAGKLGVPMHRGHYNRQRRVMYIPFTHGNVWVWPHVKGQPFRYHLRSPGKSTAAVTHAFGGSAPDLHFVRAERAHVQCGSATSAVWRNSTGYHQRFQYCRMDEAPVVVQSSRPQVPVPPAPQPTATPAPQPTAAWLPSATSTTVPSQATGVALQLTLINQERASHGYPPVALDPTESTGTASCIGAQGHAQSMAAAGTIGHWDFPADLCGSYSTGGENVGMGGGSIDQAIEASTAQMLAEPWTPGCSDNHHCNIDNPAFTRVGIGIAQANGWTFISEDFVG